MKSNFSTETTDKWGAALIRVYELQGRADFEKYQYCISKIIRLRANQKLGKKLLECVKHISKPKRVLLDTLTAIMLDDLMNTNTRILAVDALRELVPKKALQASHAGESVVQAMKDLMNSPQLSAFHNTVKNALKSINRELHNNNLIHVLSSNVAREVNP